MEIAGRIALLDPSVVDQIAAGEVIERPASVVKELLDNALDAGATRISVDAVEGGRGLIRVADDGCGMSGDEALLSLSRHATSKLRVADDLTRIETLGFRGEGLAAVAAVSRLTIETRRDEDSAGWRVSCDGGGKASRAPTARGRGTTVSVRDLFFNTPARLKFLRSKAAETAHITEMCVRIACGFPRVRFTLRHGDRVALELPAAADRLGRARAVVGRHAAELAHARLERGPMAVEICLAAPHAATRTARQLTVLVNGRPVRERRLQQAVANGYGVALRQASFPLGVVYIDVDPREVDVNVHPQKLEVRFSDEGSLLALVETCVAGLCARDPWKPRSGEVVRYSVGASQARALPAPVREAAVGGAAAAAAAVSAEALTQAREERAERRADAAARRFWSRAGEAGADVGVGSGAGKGTGTGAGTGAGTGNVPASSAGAAESGTFGALRVVGQALGRYLVLEDGTQLLVLDVARARERVAMARAEAALARGEAVPSQRLLIPARVELEPADVERAVRGQGVFTRLGLDLVASEEEQGVWFVRAVPQPLRHLAPERLARTMVEASGDAPPAARVLLARAVRSAPDQHGGDVHARALLAALDEAELDVASLAAPLSLASPAEGEGRDDDDDDGDEPALFRLVLA